MTTAPARDTTADVIMPSPVFSASFLMSDQSQAALRIATTVAMITGANFGRSSLAGIVSLLNSIRGYLFAESHFEGVKPPGFP
jgi:hypothetical protein